jgi:outer membrane protein assembly factor BamE (lipoprotein component of BamABCDE complex)
MKKILFFIVLLGLSGCGFVFQNFGEHEYKKLSRGMTKEEVIRTLGAPQKESMMRVGSVEYEVWQYPEIKLEENQFHLLSTNYYKVFFLDDKVAQWDEDKVFAQPSYKYLETIGPK